jgi:transketolase
MTDMRSEYSKSLIQVGRDNPNIVVLGADTTDSLKTSNFGKEFPNRFFNVGIAEGNLVTVSAGLAVSGKIPFARTYAILFRI